MRSMEAKSLESLGQIKKEAVSDKVVQRIMDLVKSGNLKAGDRLPAERKLIEIFNISRPSLREALRSLSVLGVIESRHGGGAFVTKLDANSLLGPLDFFVSLSANNTNEAFECRQLIEVEIARKCALNACETDLETFEQMLAAQSKVENDAIAFRILDSEFHEKLYSVGGNSMMERMAIGYYNLALEVRRKATESPGVIIQSLADHKEIVAGVVSKNPDKTAKAMENHLKNIEKTTVAAMEMNYLK